MNRAVRTTLARRRARRRGSLRASLFLSFALLSLITAALGFYSYNATRHSARLAVDIYDQSLMSISYARAAAADFAALKSTLLELGLAPAEEDRAALDRRLARLRKDLSDDLAIAAERAQSARAVAAVAAVRRAVEGWEENWRAHQADAGWAARESFSQEADRALDLLVNYTAGDGFSFRQMALASIETQRRIDLGMTAGAILLSLAISWPLAARILRPVGAASDVAQRIARGDLDVEVPNAGDDELGRLLDSMAVMQDSIRRMMDREVEQRRSAQARLIDAIESSREGVILVNAEGEILVSNSHTFELFGPLASLLKPGARFADFLSALLSESAESPDAAAEASALLASEGIGPRILAVDLRSGRSIRIGCSVTGEGGIVAFCSDVTEWKRREAELRQSNLWLDAALSNMSQGLCLFDAEGRLKIANRRFHEMFGIAQGWAREGMQADELVALGVSEAFLPGTLDTLRRREDRARSGRRGFLRQHPLHDGRVIEMAQQPMEDGGWLVTYEDATERHRAREKILFMARHDGLTGLPNRMLFGERLEEALERSQAGSRFAVLAIDLDHFKEVNDTLGHPVGDRLLHAVAQRFTSGARASDTIARLGGDEFATLLIGIAGFEDATTYATRLIDLVREAFVIDGHRIQIGASIGIAIAPDHGSDRGTLLRNADIALYRAKAAGRSGFCLFEPSMQAEMQARRAMERELLQALPGEQLELHYQPIFEARTLRLSGFEALLRWRHPERGLVSAGEFITIAEDIEAIDAIGRFVLREACRAAVEWPQDLRLAINLSPLQLRSGSFLDELDMVLAEAGLPASRLELEVTETVLLARNTATLEALQRIQRSGIAVALDDFGTGYSSLSYLHTFRFDRLKIDQSFVRGLCDDRGARAIVRAIVGLGNSLAIPTTAEGVQQSVQLEALRAEGCNEVQGFLLGRPMPASELPALFAKAEATLG